MAQKYAENGKLLKEKRLEKGLSQAELAYKANVSKRTLQDYEQGNLNFKLCSVKVALKIARVLECHIEELMPDAKEKAKMYYTNKNTGAVITEKEYLKLVDREATGLWDALDDEEKDDFGSIEKYKESLVESESDFFPSDKAGQPIEF